MFSLHDHRSPEFDCAIISSTALLKLRIFATRMIFSAAISLFLCFYNINLLINFVDSYSSILSRENSRIINPSIGIPFFHKKITHLSKSRVSDVEEIIQNIIEKKNTSYSTIGRVTGSDKVVFPELEQAGIDEKALRKSPFGKVLFGILDILFPVFKEPNWFDIYDPPMSAEGNMELPYFDGYDFVNSTWTFYIRHRYGAWNWLDRMGLVPQAALRAFLRPDGKTMWSDGFYGEWYINPAINYFQLEKHFGRGYGYSQYHRGIRVFQVQRWNFEHDIGRYWNRGLRSYLRNETNFWAIEGRVWASAVKWRPYPRDQGKFIAIRDGTNLTEVFGGDGETPWEKRFKHAMSLPFYQAHPDQLERIEDNFDMFYTNLLGREIR